MKSNNKVLQFLDNFHANTIAVLLGLMTVLTFANVVVRSVGGNILWAFEMTGVLFAWLVLIGISYGVRHHLHLGVDVFINIANETSRKVFALIAVACALAFSLMLLKGSFDYWLPFVSEQSWYEVNDIPMPSFMQFLSDWLNDGEKYEKLPRFIPYAALPIGFILVTIGYLAIAIDILRGESNKIIQSHE